MKNSLYNVLLNGAIESMKTIIDPVEKVKAITSILPFVDKTTIVEDNTPEVAAITKEVDKQVGQKMAESEAKEIEVKAQQTVVETPKVEAPAPAPTTAVDNDVKKYENMTLKEYFQGEDNSLADKFAIITELKNKMNSFFTKHMPDRPDLPDATFNYYMSMVDPENDAVQEDKMNMTIKVYLEKFVPFAKDLLTIYSYDAKTIQEELQAMSQGLYTKGIANVNYDNAGGLAIVLGETNK